MARPPPRLAKLLVLATVTLSLAGAAEALTGSIDSPPSGTWFVDRQVTVSGSASGPAVDSVALNASWGFANPTADGAAVQNGTEVHLVPTSLTNWRYFEPFNYPIGTQAADISDNYHHSFLSGAGRNWSVTAALSAKLPGSPALGATEDLGNFSNELYWHATVPRPIVGVNVSFRYAVDDGARLMFHSSVTGLRVNYTSHLDSLFDALDASSASFDLGPRFAGETTVFLRFTYSRGSNGNEWAAIDDLEVDISFAAQAGPQDVQFVQNFPFGAFNPSLDGRWWTKDGGWGGSNMLLHTSTAETWEEARFPAASDISGANLSFQLGCQAFGSTPRTIRAEVAAASTGPWTPLAETNSTAALTNYSGDVFALAGNRSFFFRVVAQNRCFLSNFNLTLSLDGAPPDMPRGALIGDPLDMVRGVDWLGASFNATVPAGTSADFWLRWGDNGQSWSRWVRATDVPLAPFSTTRFVQAQATLSAPAWGALPVVRDLTVRFSGIREVSVSVDAGASWDAMIISYAPNASQVTWSGSVILEQGMNNVQVRAIDTTGAAASFNTSLGWDTVAPPAPLVVGGPAAFVNSASLQWSWDRPVDTGLGVESYAVRVGSLPGGGDLVPLLEVGNVTNYSFANVVDGAAYYFSVRAKDLAGNWGPWGNASHGTIVDLTPPGSEAVPLPSPYVNVPRVTWSWPSFVDNGSGVDAYEVRIGTSNGSSDVVSGTVVTSPNYTLDGALHGKRYYIALRARDRAGNWGPWGPSSGPVTVDLVAPSAPGAPQGPVGSLNVTRVTWNWTAAEDFLSGVAAYEVQVGTSQGSSDLFSGYTISPTLTFTNLPDGAQVHIRVRAFDAAGNTGPWVEPAQGLTVDRTGPAAITGLYGPTGWIDRTSATWAWDPGVDDVSGLAYHEVRVGTFAGGGDLLLDYRVPGTTYSFSALIEDTAIYLSVRAVDVAGNRGDWVRSDPVLVDMSPPSVPGAITGTASPTNRTEITWSWAPSADTGSGVRSYLVRVGTTPATGDVLDWTAVANTTYTLPSVTSGSSYYFAVRAVDAVGWGSRDRAADAAVLVDLDPPEAPEVWAAAPATREAHADFFWSLVPDPGSSGVDGFDVSYGPPGGAEQQVGLNQYQFTFDIGGADGDRVALRVRAFDGAGNVGPWSDPVVVLFDNSPPSAPAAPTATVSGRSVEISWQPATDEGAGGVQYTVSIGTSPGATDIVALAITNETSYSFTGEPGATYYYSIGAVDALGNALPTPVSGDPVEVPAVAPVELMAGLAAIALGSAGVVIAVRRRRARAAGQAVSRTPRHGRDPAGDEEE